MKAIRVDTTNTLYPLMISASRVIAWGCNKQDLRMTDIYCDLPLGKIKARITTPEFDTFMLDTPLKATKPNP